MEETSTIFYNFYKICRVCLSENSVQYQIDSNVVDKILFCTSVQVNSKNMRIVWIILSG